MPVTPPYKKRSVLWPSVVAAIASVVFLAVASQLEPGPIGVDAPILQAVESARQPRITRTMVFITNLGGSAGTATITLLAVTVLLFARHARLAAFVVVANLGSLFLVRTLKATFSRPRPTPDVVMSLSDPQSLSFPSGHALSAMVLYVSIVLAATEIGNQRVVRITTFLAIIAIPSIGFSRVYLGVHFPTDVLAGWTIGFAWTWFAYFVCRAVLTTPDARA